MSIPVVNHAEIANILNTCNQILLNKETQVHLALCCMIAGGHLLLEDLPGMGKTSLAKMLTQVLGLRFSRIQMTSDMMPSDIIGVSIYRQDSHSFEFKAGPIFNHLILADELNRASPKCQSALLEAMEEQQVSVEGVTYKLEQPFFVIATQNPFEQQGTNTLPESQLDRFMMRISLGYPSPEAERTILQNQGMQWSNIPTLANKETLQQWQQQASKVTCNHVVMDYLQRLVAHTRAQPNNYGLSPRGALSLLKAAQAHAFMAGQSYVAPENIQAVFTAVAEHRLALKNTVSSPRFSNKLMQEVPVTTPLNT